MKTGYIKLIVINISPGEYYTKITIRFTHLETTTIFIVIAFQLYVPLYSDRCRPVTGNPTCVITLGFGVFNCSNFLSNEVSK